ncbi:MAG: capsular exopolysaccharide family [Anaerocolumna sp.]|nr:capsular exopolysaccharide family [Anaerocolumna sp.]
MQSINIQKMLSVDFRGHEAYNTLRTNVQFCGKEIKTICITSCTPNEGKSVVSFRLATSMAEGGKKVLFIDADLRKSVLINRLKIDQTVVGLSQYLSGMNTLDEVLYHTNIENLDIIFTGPIPPNPSDLLGSKVFSNLIQAQRDKYDYIFIDTPPLGVVIDSANVSEYCDGALLVIQTNTISYKFAQRVIKQLEKGRCRVLGAILNKVDLKHHGYYGKYYGKYYGMSYTNAES